MEYFGVDVSKDSLQVSDGQGSRKRAFRNTRQGIAGLLGWIEGASGQDGAHLILEPTRSLAGRPGRHPYPLHPD